MTALIVAVTLLLLLSWDRLTGSPVKPSTQDAMQVTSPWFGGSFRG